MAKPHEKTTASASDIDSTHEVYGYPSDGSAEWSIPISVFADVSGYASTPGTSILGADVSSGTTLTTRAAVNASYLGAYVALVTWNENTEVRRVTAISGTTVTVDTAIANSHSTNDPIFFITGQVPVAWFGAYPGLTAATLVTRLQGAIDECIDKVPAVLGYGTYDIGTTGLTADGPLQLYGVGPNETTIQYTGTGAALQINAGGAVNSQNFVCGRFGIDGTSSGAYGIQLGQETTSPKSAGGRMFDIYVTGTTTAGIYGVSAQLLLMENVRCEDNAGDGMQLASVSGGANTTVRMIGCRFKSNDIGLLVAYCGGLYLYACTFEANGDEGLRVYHANNETNQLLLSGCHFESNQGNDAAGTTAYSLFIDSSTPSDELDHLSLINVSFGSLSGGDNEHFYIDRVTDATLQECKFVSTDTGLYGEVGGNCVNVRIFSDAPSNFTLTGAQRASFYTTEPGDNRPLFSTRQGWLLVTDNITANAAAKTARLGVPHYTNAEEPVGIFMGSDNNSNDINIGGGSSLLNAATAVRIYTAANQTTQTGTLVLYIDEDQDVLLPVLPTSDPIKAGALWSNSGVLTVSAG